jgi:hypothetical protein
MDSEKIVELATIVKDLKDMPSLKPIWDEALKELHKIAAEIEEENKPTEVSHGEGHPRTVRAGVASTAEARRK